MSARRDSVLNVREAMDYLAERGMRLSYFQTLIRIKTGELPAILHRRRYLTTLRALDMYVHTLGDRALDAMRVA